MNLASNDEERFTERIEDLRIENEILKMKMQAETGGIFGGISDLPPELENIFLHHVQSFEEAWRNARQVKIYDLIGKPEYKNENELDNNQVQQELKALLDLLARHNIIFHGAHDHDARHIYRLITGEMFQLEVSDIQLPGMTMCFSYGDFKEDGNIE